MTNGYDIIVLGGGPAGAVSAWLGARDGLRTLLIDPGRATGRLEGMSPRLHHWLRQVGLGTGDSLHGPYARRVSWGGDDWTANGEFLVMRDHLDAHLRRAAQRAGADVIQETGTIEARQITLASGRKLAARWLVDARGRVAHRTGRHQDGFSTVALCGWLTGRAQAHGRPGTAGVTIRSLEEGWIWRADLPDGRTWVQYTCDARSPLRAPERLSRALRLAYPDEALDVTGQTLARQAAPVLPVPVDDLHALPVGDALSAMDPLSGQGMFWAVSSALAAVATRRSLMARPGPESEALCRRYLNERALGTYMRNARVGRDFIRLETGHAGNAFWAARAGFPDELPAHETIAHPQIRRGLVVRDGVIDEMEMLCTPDAPEGIGWFGTVPAATLWRRLAAGETPEALCADYGAGIAPALERLAPFAPATEAVTG